MSEPPRVLNATTLLGHKVVNRAGEQLGQIKDLVVDLEEGQVAYVVLSFGGFLGRGDKLFAIPLEALMFRKDHTAVLDMSREALQNAPGFDKDQWPDDAQYQAGWLLDLYQYYGYSPYWRPDK